MDSEFNVGENIIHFAGHAHCIIVEDIILDDGEKKITDHLFRRVCGRMPCQQFQKIRSAPRMCWWYSQRAPNTLGARCELSHNIRGALRIF